MDPMLVLDAFDSSLLGLSAVQDFMNFSLPHPRASQHVVFRPPSTCPEVAPVPSSLPFPLLETHLWVPRVVCLMHHLLSQNLVPRVLFNPQGNEWSLPSSKQSEILQSLVPFLWELPNNKVWVAVQAVKALPWAREGLQAGLLQHLQATVSSHQWCMGLSSWISWEQCGLGLNMNLGNWTKGIGLEFRDDGGTLN